MSRELLLAKIASWSTEEAQRTRGRVDRALVHKHRDENVALARIDRYDPDHPNDRCVAEILVDTGHAYFFEHPIDHVPALLLIEAMRQAATASLHHFLDVPDHVAMVVDELTVSFQTYAELDEPLFVVLIADQLGHRGERLSSAEVSAEYLQGGKTLGTARMRARLIWWARE